MVLACYVARASAQVRKPLSLIACGVWRLRRLGLPNASLSFRRGAQVAPSLRFLDLVNAFAMRCFAVLVMLLAAIAGAAEPREDLKPLGAHCFVTCFAWREARMRALLQWLASAQHRQQHRRTLDGRLCAAAFVFDRQTHTGCSDGTNPAGEHGREWCYVDAQVVYSSGIGVRCLDSVFRCCVACSCWVAVVASPRGVIAVLHLMRRAR